MNAGNAPGAAATTAIGRSTRTGSSASTTTRTMGAYQRGMPSSTTSRPIRVDSSGWPIYEVQRAVWKWPLCQHCRETTARTLLPLDNLGQAWWQDAGPGHSLIALCQKCYLKARSAYGRVMRYTMKDGKIKQHVDEELFGGDI